MKTQLLTGDLVLPALIPSALGTKLNLFSLRHQVAAALLSFSLSPIYTWEVSQGAYTGRAAVGYACAKGVGSSSFLSRTKVERVPPPRSAAHSASGSPSSEASRRNRTSSVGEQLECVFYCFLEP